MTRRPRLGAAVAALATVALLAAPAGPAAAQSVGVRLVVTDLTGVIGPGAVAPTEAADDDGDTSDQVVEDATIRLLVENRGDGDLDGLRVVVESWGRVDTRSEMRAALDGGDIPALANSPVDLLVADGDTLAGGEVTGLEVTLTPERLGVDPDEASVHPVQISVVRGTAVLDQVRTAVIHLPSPPTAPLETVIVWPLTDAPWRGPGGLYAARAGRPIAPGGRLDRLLRVLEQHPELPLTLAPSAHLLEDLRDRADGFTSTSRVGGDDVQVTVDPEGAAAVSANDFLRRVRTVATDAPVTPVAGAYADVPLAGLADAPPALTELTATAAVDGRRRLQDLLSRRPDQGTFLATSAIDRDGLDLVAAEQVLVAYDRIDGPDLGESPNVDLPYALRRTTTSTGRPIDVIVADPWVTELIGRADDAHGPVLAAHRVVVETALAHLRSPSTSGRPLLVLPPLDWDPPGRFAEVLATALTDAPWLRIADAGALPARAGRTPGSVRFATPGLVVPPTLAAEITAADQALDAAVAALPEGAPIGERTRDALAQQLLRSPSTWFLRDDAAPSRALVADVADTVDRSFGTVEVPDSARVTLTSDRGTIPVTIQRQGGPITVQVTVDSQGGLAWPAGRTSPPVTLVEDGIQTVSFETRALSTGTFAVTVTVTDPTGNRVLDRARLSVRSTSISGTALTVTGLIVAMLLLRGLLRKQPPDRPKLEVVR